MPDTREDNFIGKRMRQAMDRAGLTSGDVACRMDVTDGTVRGWTTGRRAISIEMLRLFASVVGAPVESFIYEKSAVPEDVTESILTAGSREEKINAAFRYLCTIPDLKFGSTAMGSYPLEARLGIVRMYERLTGEHLLPDDVI